MKANKFRRRMTAAISLALVFCSAEAWAQDGPEAVPSKPDLDHTETFSLPPMDPYSLTYKPERPKDVPDIENEEQCKAQKGKWVIANEIFDWSTAEHWINVSVTGCLVGSKRQGLWRMTEEKPAPKSIVDDTKAIGYMWVKDGKRTGWVVQLHEPQGIVKGIAHYADDKLNGAVLFWDEYGSLVESVHYKNGHREGKFETYMESLPTAIGQYDSEGRPTGIWTFYEEPGMISMRRNFDLTDAENDHPNAYWTEWFNGEGIRIVEGYSDMPLGFRPEDPGKRVGNMRFYSGTGGLWMDVRYGNAGQINDSALFELCKPYGVKNAPIPEYLDFDHSALSVNCKNSEGEVYQVVNYYPEGQLWQIVEMSDGARNGNFREFHPDGALLAQYRYANDVPVGTIQYLDAHGEPMGEFSTVTNGSGDFTAYWYNGNRREQGRYRVGVKDGTWMTWYVSGTLESEIGYKRGVQDGVERSWFKNGVVGGERYYVRGIRDGIYFGNYSDGRIAFKYRFSNDRIIDKVYKYTHDGVVESETDYSATYQAPYPRTYFYNDGKPKASGKVFPGFGEGVRDVEWTYFLRNGEQWYSVVYDSSGNPVHPAAEKCQEAMGEFVIDAENREIGCVTYSVNRETPLARHKRREGYWEWYNEQGKLEKSGTLKLGHLNGEWRYYYVNGKPMLIGHYLIDKRVGKWSGFYEDGQPKFDGSYSDGLEAGYWKTFHPGSGEVSSEGEFVAGKRHGKWTWRYASGKVREVGTYEHGVEVGTWTQYHENGQKLGEGSYVEGKREGEWQWWRDNGKLWRKANFEKGREKQ